MDTDDLKQWLSEAGVARFGIIDAEPVGAGAEAMYAHWLSAGRAGAMAFAARYGDVRSNPQMLLDGNAARSLTVCLFAYPSAPANENPASQHIAEYALGMDYHIAVRTRLMPVAGKITENFGGEARVCVDTAPLRERLWATRAGLGFVGRNNMLTVPGVGAHFVIGTIVTSHHFAERTLPRHGRCGACRRCVDACPTGAITGNGDIETHKCLAYRTIEDPEVRGAVEGRLFGCDICRRVCPHHHPGRNAADMLTNTPLPELTPRPAITALTPENWAALTRGQARRLLRDTALGRKRR